MGYIGVDCQEPVIGGELLNNFGFVVGPSLESIGFQQNVKERDGKVVLVTLDLVIELGLNRDSMDIFMIGCELLETHWIGAKLLKGYVFNFFVYVFGFYDDAWACGFYDWDCVFYDSEFLSLLFV